MSYTKPKLKSESFTCPHCNTLSTQDYTTASFPIDDCVGVKTVQVITHVAKCLNCGNRIIWVGEKYIYPDISPVEAQEDMPEVVLKLYNEAGAIYNKSPRAACALLRLAIDRLCNELGETDRDINKNIASLVKKGLPIEVQKSLDIVRVVGNKAVHPGQIAFDVDDVKTAEMLFNLVNIIVCRLISEPKKLDELYDALPESTKGAIEKRDK